MYSLNAVPEVTAVLADELQLGFNDGEDPWWNEDVFVLEFDDLEVTSGTLTFVIYASSGGLGTGFQGEDDESFAIDNFIVTAEVPEPFVIFLGGFSLLYFLTRRHRGLRT